MPAGAVLGQGSSGPRVGENVGQEAVEDGDNCSPRGILLYQRFSVVCSKCHLVPLAEAPAPALTLVSLIPSLHCHCETGAGGQKAASPKTHSKLGRARIQTQDFVTLQGGAGLIHNRSRSLMRAHLRAMGPAARGCPVEWSPMASGEQADHGW